MKEMNTAEFLDAHRALMRRMLANMTFDELLDMKILPVMRKKPANMIILDERRPPEDVIPIRVQKLLTLAWGLRPESHSKVHATLRGPVVRSAPCEDDTACWAEFEELWAPDDPIVAKDLGDAMYMLVRDRNDAPCAAGFLATMGGNKLIGRVSVPCSLVHIPPEDLKEYGFENFHPKDRRRIQRAFGDPVTGEEFLSTLLAEMGQLARELIGVPIVPRHAMATAVFGHADGPILSFIWLNIRIDPPKEDPGGREDR